MNGVINAYPENYRGQNNQHHINPDTCKAYKTQCQYNGNDIRNHCQKTELYRPENNGHYDKDCHESIYETVQFTFRKVVGHARKQT